MKIMLFERDLEVAKRIREHVKHCEELWKVELAIVPVRSLYEATLYVPHADIAIIDVNDEGVSVAHDAVELYIPVIAVGLQVNKTSVQFKPDQLQYVTLPDLRLEEFRTALSVFVLRIHVCSGLPIPDALLKTEGIKLIESVTPIELAPSYVRN
jgi:hypothetical protein